MFFRKKEKWIRLFDDADGLKRRIPVGQSETFTVAGTEVCIAHVKAGLFAVEDRCPHQGVSLGGGICTDEENIVCPLHKYQFNVRDGKGRAGYIDTYPLEEREDGVYVKLKVSNW